MAPKVRGFALASLAVERRVKEIGIRKVLGASANQLAFLLSREYLFYIAVANAIAWPVAYVMTDEWLLSFAHKAEVGFSPFLLAGISCAAVGMVAVVSHTYRTILLDPTECLRAD